ncbi:hypothetical protein AOLI_G00076450 [Acnodon oligacanthus]
MCREGCKLLHPAITLPGAIFSPLLLGPESSAQRRGSVRPARERVGIPPQSAAACECTRFGMSQMLQPPTPSSLVRSPAAPSSPLRSHWLPWPPVICAPPCKKLTPSLWQPSRQEEPWCCLS